MGLYIPKMVIVTGFQHLGFHSPELRKEDQFFFLNYSSGIDMYLGALLTFYFH